MSVKIKSNVRKLDQMCITISLYSDHTRLCVLFTCLRPVSDTNPDKSRHQLDQSWVNYMDIRQLFWIHVAIPILTYTDQRYNSYRIGIMERS